MPITVNHTSYYRILLIIINFMFDMKVCLICMQFYEGEGEWYASFFVVILQINKIGLTCCLLHSYQNIVDSLICTLEYLIVKIYQ